MDRPAQLKRIKAADYAPQFAHPLPDCIDTPENRMSCMLASMIGMNRALAEMLGDEHPLIAARLNRQADEAEALMEPLR